MKLKPATIHAVRPQAGASAPGRRRADFSPYLARAAARPTPHPAPPPKAAAAAASPPPAAPLVEINGGLFDLPVEARFAHAVDPNDLKEIRLGIRVRRAAADPEGRSRLEVEAVVLDQAGRAVPDAVVLALADPSGSGEAAGGGFLPNTDVFGRTRGTISAAARNVKLLVVTGTGLQTARELEVPPG